ncbi:MAG: hypothetical protein ACMUEL_04765 [Flavobacteriales bacterium Tduv]
MIKLSRYDGSQCHAVAIYAFVTPDKDVGDLTIDHQFRETMFRERCMGEVV